MNENERVKELRKARGLTLEQFGKRVGVTRGAMSAIENGHRNVTDQMRKSICREFGVLEEWLRTGEGAMEPSLSREDEIARAVAKMASGENAEFKRRLVLALSELTEEQWVFLAQKACEIVGLAPTQEEEDAVKVASYAAELRAQRESEGRSSASPTGGAKEA